MHCVSTTNAEMIREALLVADLKIRPGQLRTDDDPDVETKQHTSPCADCPWARASLPGWLGSTGLGKFLVIAHNHGPMECHTRVIKGADAAECAGAAIYRKNVCQSVDPGVLRLPADREKCWGQPLEFAQHHSRGEIVTHERLRKVMMKAKKEIFRELATFGAESTDPDDE